MQSSPPPNVASTLVPEEVLHGEMQVLSAIHNDMLNEEVDTGDGDGSEEGEVDNEFEEFGLDEEDQAGYAFSPLMLDSPPPPLLVSDLF